VPDAVSPRDKLIAEKPAAELLGVTAHCLRHYRGSGDGPPFVKLSPKCVRYRVGDLLDWIQSRTVTHVQEGAPCK
jgi:predicted DNA-binding transcriptional regulator AlpA